MTLTDRLAMAEFPTSPNSTRFTLTHSLTHSLTETSYHHVLFHGYQQGRTRRLRGEARRLGLCGTWFSLRHNVLSLSSSTTLRSETPAGVLCLHTTVFLVYVALLYFLPRAFTLHATPRRPSLLIRDHAVDRVAGWLAGWMNTTHARAHALTTDAHN